MILRLFGYQFPLFLASDYATQSNNGFNNVYLKPEATLVFTTAAFGFYYEQFTPEQQRNILKVKPFFRLD